MINKTDKIQLDIHTINQKSVQDNLLNQCLLPKICLKISVKITHLHQDIKNLL